MRLIVEERKAAAFKATEGFEELERRAYDDTEFIFLRADSLNHPAQLRAEK